MTTTSSSAPATTDTQVTCKVPISTQARSAIGSMQWFLEKGVDKRAPVFHRNSVNYFICGEDAFRDIAASVKGARESVDIICWGFDPAMELTRDASTQWPRGDTWASLLLGAATGQWTHGKPVQVRVLSWFDCLAGMDNSIWGNNNMPGYVGWGQHAPVSEAKRAQLSAWLKPGQATRATETRERREWVNQHWFALAASGTLDSLALRIRNGNGAAIKASLRQANPLRDDRSLLDTGPLESFLMGSFGTYHQKTVLIDYDDSQPGAQPMAYVMGLNSVTDYWDTRAHLHTDLRRGKGWEGVARGEEANLKPYQDYATRIQGDALVMVAMNFTDAWNAASANGSGRQLTRTCKPEAPPAHLISNAKARQSVQIVRTEPQAKPRPEQSIERLYYQTAASARQYIYIENQYFQYAPWIKVLKARREAYVKLHAKAGTAKSQLPELHLMVVTPMPERPGMVPRTHDAIKELGFGSSMPNQSRRNEEEIKRYKPEMVKYESRIKKYQELNHLAPGYQAPPIKPPISDISRTYQASGGDKADADIQDFLREFLGLRTLVASLWTFDHEYASKQRKLLSQIDALQVRAQNAASNANATDATQDHKAISAVYANQVKALQDQAFAERYREIYIHSKLMLADDSMFTIGSANMNARSFYGDGEINMVTDCPNTSAKLRQEVWAMHSGGGGDYDGGDGSAKSIGKAFKSWQTRVKLNGYKKKTGEAIDGFLVPLLDERTSDIRVD